MIILAQQDTAAYENLMLELQALNAKMGVVAQRMKIIEKNEQIIGKTLITHAKEIKELQSGGVSIASSGGGEVSGALDDFRKIAVEVQSSLDKIKADVQKNRDQIDKIKSELGEMKYILDTINPVSYVTVDQVEDLIDEKLKKKRL